PVGSHTYRVQAVSGGSQFYVDGVLKTTISATLPAGTQLHAALSSFSGSQPALVADSITSAAYVSTGTYSSIVFDAGKTSTWGTATWTATLPAGTGILVETSSGNTATPDGTWSAWSAVSNGGS